MAGMRMNCLWRVPNMIVILVNAISPPIGTLRLAKFKSAASLRCGLGEPELKGSRSTVMNTLLMGTLRETLENHRLKAKLETIKEESASLESQLSASRDAQEMMEDTVEALQLELGQYKSANGAMGSGLDLFSGEELLERPSPPIAMKPVVFESSED